MLFGDYLEKLLKASFEAGKLRDRMNEHEGSRNASLNRTRGGKVMKPYWKKTSYSFNANSYSNSNSYANSS